MSSKAMERKLKVNFAVARADPDADWVEIPCSVSGIATLHPTGWSIHNIEASTSEGEIIVLNEMEEMIAEDMLIAEAEAQKEK